MKTISKERIDALIDSIPNTTSFRYGAHQLARLVEAELAQQGEPVAIVDANDEGYWADILPNRSVKVGQLLYAGAAPAAQPDDAIIRAWQAGYYHAGYTNDQSYADKMAREYAGAAPAAQPVSALGIAGIGLKHFGNPIPQAWYGAAKELMLAAAPAAQAQPVKTPGMAVQALAGEIIEALLADEKDGGYDLTAGMFGANFSALVRRWVAAEWSAQQPSYPGNEADDLLRNLGLDPEHYRTEGGWINHLKVKAAIRHPEDYAQVVNLRPEDYARAWPNKITDAMQAAGQSAWMTSDGVDPCRVFWAMIAATAPQHELYEDGDKNIPDAICDRNGAVVLGMCKRCGKAEVELAQPCEPKIPQPDSAYGKGEPECSAWPKCGCPSIQECVR